MFKPLLYAIGICFASAGLEGVFAGSGIRKRFAELRLPRFVPPLWAWVAIGLAYYAICFVLLLRLFSLPENPLRDTCLALLGTVMFINALWNYFFFRSRNLFHAFLIGLPYSLLAVTLFLLLIRLDRVAAWTLSPYLTYLLYANVWGYRMWKLNPQAPRNDVG